MTTTSATKATINLSAVCGVCSRCARKTPKGCSKNYAGLINSNWCNSFSKMRDGSVLTYKLSERM